ncbi:MAG: dTMP kinase [Firmicutes bacterium]|nr:dTMP kinase [Bacillota bacterium]
MKNTSGKFITIEGCEGVGKSTQTRFLREYCEKFSIDAVFTREPGGTPISEQIRAVILDAAHQSMDSLTELLLYAAARRQHTAEIIAPALAAGKIVFCDRYSDSTLAYQGYARGIDKQIINVLNRFAMGETEIDYTIFMDVHPKNGFLRKGGANASDRLENEGLAFHEKVYGGFKEIEKSAPHRFLSFKATGTKFETHALIIAALKERGVLT